jgi:radical SAM superfamily enzyme
MDVFDHEHKTSQCRLFNDCSKTGLKAVLMHSGNKLHSVLLAYATKMKKTYANLKILLEISQYDQYCWSICCELKAIALLMGLQ